MNKHSMDPLLASSSTPNSFESTARKHICPATAVTTARHGRVDLHIVDPRSPTRRNGETQSQTRAAASLYHHDFFAWTCIWLFDAVPRSTLHGPHTRTSRCYVTAQMHLSVYTMLVVPLYLSLPLVAGQGRVLRLAASKVSCLLACFLPRMPCFFQRDFLKICLLPHFSDESDLTGIIRTARYCLSIFGDDGSRRRSLTRSD
jgi:hypothetical protein